MTLRWHLALGPVVWLLLPGCVGPEPGGAVSISRAGLKRDALSCLHAAIGYKHNAVVRIEAVEALEASGLMEGRPWIRSALLDEQPAVRFAACVAIGMVRDRVAEGALRSSLTDRNASVRAAALFSLHRLGVTQRTGELARYLLDQEDPTVRRNAALVLGLLDEPGAVKVLARAMRDADEGVRQHALEAMARLSNPEARQELTFMASSGIGSEEVFAIMALSNTRDPRYLDAFRYKLQSAAHLETRLAAAGALGKFGSGGGYDLALRALTVSQARSDDPNDPPAGQKLRIKQMAAAALGAIGRADALPALAKMLRDPSDPRVQVSAARAILEILRANRSKGLPFPPVAGRGGTSERQ